MINKTDFPINITNESTTIGSRTLWQQGHEGDSVEFWTDLNATYRPFNLESVKGSFKLDASTDSLYDEVSSVIEIHYEAKEEKLFFVFSSPRYTGLGTKIWFF